MIEKEKTVETMYQHTVYNWGEIEPDEYADRNQELSILTRSLFIELGTEPNEQIVCWFSGSIDEAIGDLTGKGWESIMDDESEWIYKDGKELAKLTISCRGSLFIADVQFADGRYWKATDGTDSWTKDLVKTV